MRLCRALGGGKNFIRNGAFLKLPNTDTTDVLSTLGKKLFGMDNFMGYSTTVAL